MTALTRRSSRAVWGWCLVYTAVAEPAQRERRRGEIHSHLWESERARLAGATVVCAAVRGVLDDLLWVCVGGLPRLVRSFATPTPYVVLAPAFPVEGWIASAVTVGSTAHAGEAVGMFGGIAMLSMAGLVWLIRRR